MAAPIVSERAKWDGRQRQNSKSRRSSTSLARDPYHIPPETHSLDILQSQAKLSDSRRAGKAAFHSNHERDSLTNSSSHARLRLSGRVDTSSTSSRHPHEPSITVKNTAPNPALHNLSLITASHLTPNSFLTASRTRNPRPTMSRDRTTSSQPKSTVDTEVIDLTVEDTEDELTVKNLLLSNSTSANSKGKHVDPGPSRRLSSSAHSSPIAVDQSLFTPPPPTRKRTRFFIDFIRIPSFPKGLTRADYEPLFDRPVVSLPSNTVTDRLDDPFLAEPSVEKDGTSRKRKGKEREVELDVSSPKKHRRCSADAVDLIPGEILDAIYEHSLIPVYDDEAYPPLTNLELATNTRFQFANAWRGHASKLREAEREWMFKVFGNACIWPANAPSPRIPGTVGYVSTEQLRPWRLALPGDPPEGERVDEQTESQATLDINVDCLPLPDDPLPGPSTALDPAPSNPTLAQGSAVVDMEDDMHQYFNGLGDSPTKHIPPRPPTHTFRPQLLQSTGRSGMHSLGLPFPSLDLRLADTGDHQCFLGVPPSPPPADMEPSATSGPISEPSLESTYAPASPSNVFEEPPVDTWSFEQGEGLLVENDSPLDNPVEPASLGTIDPSLLGPEQSQKSPRAPENPTPKRRSKLPEPVIYMRRPIDSSSLPNLSGKRSVQIKYRESERSRAPSDPGVDPVEEPKNDSPPARRRSAPSHKLREHPLSDSDSDYVPEPSASGIKLKVKRPSLRAKEKEPVVERQEPVPLMTFCHQCRRTTERPKMLCSNVVQGRVCGKRFCNRCILYRYPDVTFDEDSAGFLCPVCTNTCNCSHCSRNRGEEFISMRLGGLAASLFKTRVTLVRDVVGNPLSHTHSPPPRPAANVDGRQSASTVTTPTPDPGAMPTPSHFWAHVYGMEGEHVGSAFMTRGNMAQLQTSGPPAPLLSQPQPPIPKPAKKARQSTTRREKKREQPKGPRVFIGRPLAWWKMRGVRDLEPSADVVTTTTTTQGTRRRRCFIGHAAPLYEPYGRMPGATGSSTTPTTTTSRCTTPVLDSDGSLTPLSELQDGDGYDWPQPAVGECCAWAPPGSVVRAVVVDPNDGRVPLLGGGDGAGLGSGSGVEVQVNMDVEEEPKGVSPLTGLSDEQIKMAISAALAAVDGGGA